MIVRQDQIAHHGGLVRIAREAHLERDLRERLGGLRARRHREERIGAAHEGDGHLPRAHALERFLHLGVAGEAVEARDRLRRQHGGAHVAELLVERVHREREVRRVSTVPAGHDQARLRLGDLLLQLLDLRDRHPARLRGGRGRHRAGQRLRDRDAGARLAGEPLVGVEAGERAARADVPEARRAVELGARVGEVELLRDRRAPLVEEVRVERHDQLRRAEVERRPGDAVRLQIRGDRTEVGDRGPRSDARACRSRRATSRGTRGRNRPRAGR